MSPSTALKRDARYTWADYRSWPQDERWELIDGVAYGMSAAPSIRHQDVAGGMFSRIERVGSQILQSSIRGYGVKRVGRSCNQAFLMQCTNA